MSSMDFEFELATEGMPLPLEEVDENGCLVDLDLTPMLRYMFEQGAKYGHHCDRCCCQAAYAWLFSGAAADMTCAEARDQVAVKFGQDVAEELERRHGKPTCD